MRTPLRYTYANCSGRLITITTGPAGASSGIHRYSPGFSANAAPAFVVPDGVGVRASTWVPAGGAANSCADRHSATATDTTPASLFDGMR